MNSKMELYNSFLDSMQECIAYFANGRLSDIEIKALAESIVGKLDFENKWQMHKGLGYFARKEVEKLLF